METFAQRLRRLRNEQGLSVADLGRMVGVTEGAIRQLETGQVASPGFLLGLRLSDALHVEPHVLALGGVSSVVAKMEDLDRRLRAAERWIAEQPKRR